MAQDKIEMLERILPGLLGSFGALLWIKAPWPQKIAMFILGASLAHYGGAYAATALGIPSGLAGFLIGLFGMSVVDGVFKAPVTALVMDIIKARFGVPPKGDA